MIGDTPYDVEASRRAGIRAVAFECGGWGCDDLRGAVACYRDPADLLARYPESVLARVDARPRPVRSNSGQGVGRGPGPG